MRMANEAVILEINEYANAKQYTCAAGTSISKGCLLELSGANTVIASAVSGGVYAGVAAMDKDGTDSSTKIAVYVPNSLNKYDMYVGGTTTISAGHMVSLSGANQIKHATEAEVITGAVIGRVMESGATSATVVVLS